MILALELFNCACFTRIWIWHSACVICTLIVRPCNHCHTTHTHTHVCVDSWHLFLVCWSNCVIFLSALIVFCRMFTDFLLLQVSWWCLHYFQNSYSLHKQNFVYCSLLWSVAWPLHRPISFHSVLLSVISASSFDFSSVFIIVDVHSVKPSAIEFVLLSLESFWLIFWYSV